MLTPPPPGTDYFADDRAFVERLARFGYRPKVIFDVGGSNGWWSRTVAAVHPQAQFHLFEPLAADAGPYAEHWAANKAACANLTMHPIALGDHTGHAEIHCTPEGFGSSLHATAGGQVRRVPLWRLDEYVQKHALPSPNLIKMDVQGTEDAILRGCGELLKTCDVLMLETWLYRGYGQKTPLLTELLQQLTPMGFVLTTLAQPYWDPGHRLTSVDAFLMSRRLLDELKEPSNGWQW
jgi:FkbM family methyltransferase